MEYYLAMKRNRVLQKSRLLAARAGGGGGGVTANGHRVSF